MGTVGTLIRRVCPNDIPALFLVFEYSHNSEQSFFYKFIHSKVILDNLLVDTFFLRMKCAYDSKKKAKDLCEFHGIAIAFLYITFYKN